MRRHKALLIAAASLFLLAQLRFQPAALITLGSGELAMLDNRNGVAKLTSSNVLTRLINSFAAYEAGGFAEVRSGELVVTQQMRFKSSATLTRVARFNAAGARTGEWVLPPGGALAGIVVDPANHAAYCVDSQVNAVYRFQVDNPKMPYTVLTRMPEAGNLGPIALDASRRRLLVGDVQKGAIISIGIDDRKIIVLDSHSVAEPVAIAIDVKNDRVFIADASARRIWAGPLSKWKLQQFNVAQKLGYPIGVAVGKDGSLWVADSKPNVVYRFDTRDGRTLQIVKP
jgi:sugar lactone lactonase YvrE